MTGLVLEALLVGGLAPLGERGVPSGIDKRPVNGRVSLGPEGFIGDAQGDRRHHGGPEKAVHHYAADHYPAWRAEIGPRDVLAARGAFGENLSTHGLDEATVAVGDTFRLGGAVLQVSQGRQPCWRLNARFGVRDMALRVQRSGRTGWYYRVTQPGTVAAGDPLVLVDRPSPDWTIERLCRLFYVDVLDRDGLAAMAALPHLAEGWRDHARRRLRSGDVEDWTRRLTGEQAEKADGARDG